MEPSAILSYAREIAETNELKEGDQSMVIITEKVREVVVKLDTVLDPEPFTVARAALVVELAEIIINNNRQEPVKEGVESAIRDLKSVIFTILERAKNERRE